MDYAGHLALSAACGLLLLYLFFPSLNEIESGSLMLVCLASSLVADIDHPKSRASGLAGQASIWFSALLALAVLLRSGSPLLAAIAFAAPLLLWHALWPIFRPRHRTLMHSMAFLAFYSLLALLLSASPPVALFAAVGFSSHLLADWTFRLI